MASTKRQRELERQRAARQAAARAAAQHRRRRRGLIAGGTVVAVLLVGVIGLVAALSGGGGKKAVSPAARPTPSGSATAKPSTSASTSASASVSPSASPATPAVDTRPLACGVAKAPALLAVQHHYTVAPPMEITAGASYQMTITTTCGVIKATLDAAKAPKTVNSFYFLARQRYFTNTECHRATRAATLTVLQCGDPTATGSGGPGYSLPDENLAGATYPRGTLAMANSGPNTGGSQFFLVDKDSKLGPNYTPFGSITAGIDVLDKIIANGIAPGGGSPDDGKPAQRVFLSSVVLGKLA